MKSIQSEMSPGFTLSRLEVPSLWGLIESAFRSDIRSDIVFRLDQTLYDFVDDRVKVDVAMRVTL